jgi:hypothetical protein
MLLIIVVAITAIALGKILRVPTPADMTDAHLGWMSQQWLAEHRAAHPS